jgi:hypothetical protein
MKYFLLCDDFRGVPDIAFDGQHPISQEGSLWADNTGKPGQVDRLPGLDRWMASKCWKISEEWVF